MANVLVTGGAGFVGYHLIKRLLNEGHQVVSIDNLNTYYDIDLKNARLSELKTIDTNNYTFYKADISDRDAMQAIFDDNPIEYVVNLAAQAGVRYARQDPNSYIKSNINGFYNVISLASKKNIKRFLYASSSSVYGASVKIPFSEDDGPMLPMSLYAATKLANESLASAYYFSDDLPVIGMRFFNVYGPWGRPDMAYYKWTKCLYEGSEVELRNDGEMWRDMTYVDDVVESITRLLFNDLPNESAPRVVNIGNRNPVKISDMLHYISASLDIEPKILSMPKGTEEPLKTWADTSRLSQLVGYSPDTDYQEGLDRFLEWYKQYFNETT